MPLSACLFSSSGCFSGNGKETTRHSRFLQGSEVQAAGRRFAGVHFEFSQSQLCLELVTYEAVFGCGSANSFESILRFHDRVGSYSLARRNDLELKASSRVLAFCSKFLGTINFGLRFNGFSLSSKSIREDCSPLDFVVGQPFSHKLFQCLTQ